MGRFLVLFSSFLVFSSVTFSVVFSFQFRNAAVNVAEAGSDVRLRGAQMEEVSNSRVKEINFSMRALFPGGWRGGQISELIEKEASIKVLHLCN